jgi:hypothetical protein
MTTKISVTVRIDKIDSAVLEIFLRHPNRSFKTNQIRAILEFEGIDIGYGKLAMRLQRLTELTLLVSMKGASVYNYKLNPELPGNLFSKDPKNLEQKND